MFNTERLQITVVGSNVGKLSLRRLIYSLNQSNAQSKID